MDQVRECTCRKYNKTQSWEKPQAPQARLRNAQRFPRNTQDWKQHIIINGLEIMIPGTEYGIIYKYSNIYNQETKVWMQIIIWYESGTDLRILYSTEP